MSMSMCLIAVAAIGSASALSRVDTLAIRVEASYSAGVGALLQSLPSRWGSVLFANDAPMGGAPPEPILSCIAGKDATGREVIALLDEPLPSQTPFGTTTVHARASATFEKPPSMGAAQAASFPLVTLRAAAALERVGWGGEARQTDSPTALVAGSSGRMPPLLVQLLLSRGVRPVVAARAQDAEELRRLGASRVIDHDSEDWAECLEQARHAPPARSPPPLRGRSRRDSWPPLLTATSWVRSSQECAGERECSALGPVAAVLDCVGEEEVPQLLQERLGATYVSVASPTLLEFIGDGAVAATARAVRRWRAPERPCVWSAGSESERAVASMLRLVADGSLVPPAAPDDARELASEYAEALSWARDADSGQRLGFPGRNLWAVPDAPYVPTPRVQAPELEI